ncbi:MAG TPA: ASCH domain-containing protein [Acidiphilium sp.]|nr:ASCH domain-containing protein [Acidiphilium sp.]HQU22953.1 ASCH domain-containing protein [Acidiphilium sp.]
MSMIEPFWSGFCARTGITGPVPPVTAFGDPGAQQDALAALVLAGRKRATAGLLAEYEAEQLPLPQKGDLEIFTDGSATPLGVIRTTEMRVGPFISVDAAFAADEGEGDGSLDYWRDEHRRFFQAVADAQGYAFSEQSLVVFVRFELIG